MISLIVAIGVDNIIGMDNDLPWNYPEDLKYFKKVTKGKTVIMGLNTFISITDRLGHPLPNRKNIVATLDKNFSYEGVEVVYDFISFLKDNLDTEEEIFVIGGKQIYSLCLDYVQKMYITHVNKYHDGNVYFPSIDYTKFNKVSSDVVGDLEFAVYERKLD
jgi:dihydrofolate reductase